MTIQQHKKKNLSESQLNKIKESILLNLESNIKEIHNHYKDYFKNPLSYKRFKGVMIDYILKGVNDSDSLKIFDDYTHLEYEKEHLLNEFKEDIKNIDTTDLINFDSDSEQFNDNSFYDYDFIKEDICLRFILDNDKSYYDYIGFNNYDNNAYLKIQEIESILNDYYYYDYTFKEFLNELDNIIYNYDLKNVFFNLINDYHNKDFIFKYTGISFNILDSQIKKEIKKELENRKKDLFKQNRYIKKQIKDIKKELENNHNKLIEFSLISLNESILKNRDFNLKEIKEIKEYLKGLKK